MSILGSGDLKSFSDALQSINFWKASSINPKGMKNNCVSVSLAVQNYYRDVYQMWKALRGTELPDKCLSFDEIADLLRLTNWGYVWKWYETSESGTAYEAFEKDDYGWKVKNNNDFLFIYIRPDDFGHCVNLYRRQLEKDKPPQKIYLDFQKTNSGNVNVKDIEGAVKIVVLYKRYYMGSIDDYPMKEIEKRRNEMVRAGIFPAGFQVDTHGLD